MTEVKRWLEDSPPPEIRALLEQARHESAPPRVLRGTLVALGTTSATTAMAGAGGVASGGAKASMLGILLKWGGAGLLAGTVVAGGAAGVDRIVTGDRAASVAKEEHAPPSTTAANPSPDLPRAGAPRAPAPEPAPTTEVTPPPSAPRSSSVTPPANPAAAARPSEPPPAADATTGEPASAPEIALVDGAMSALRAGDAAGAARSLAGYETRFVPAHLEPEVLFLRMVAAQARQDDGEARRNASLIVSRFPKSPGVGRAEEILKAAGATTKE
ncbi:MAG TPA: hypothetical protein VMI54_07975 [Polyangiaceae bacterium]|nr:hypothetical protein [Polyangiaceae bacterium]